MTDNNTALKKAGLKVTLPRLKILEVLQGPDNHHVSAEDLYKRLIDMGEEIGLATVYRVLNQFDDSIEARQREIASRHGIRLTNHSLYLYGHCAEGDCREDENAHEIAEK